ncbi:MAG TPA: hypothetical protein VHO24_12035 [Opitutaceae bacterium]|nr:hypothetical protein [Opitutaceae bacterium]
MKSLLFIIAALVAHSVRGQIPVTDFANLTNNRISQVENIAKWIESIAQLRTQIDQLNRQIDIQGDIRQWTGNPVDAGGRLVLDALDGTDLLREFGQTRAAVVGAVKSLDSLGNTGGGNYREIASADLDGNELARDSLTYRRYAILDATQANADQVTAETKARELRLQEEIAATVQDLKTASTDAEVQKQAAKLTALNGQLAQVEAARRREVDAVALQKIANDARLEAERLAAAELAAKDDFLANRRVSTYLGNLKLRK